MLTWLLDYSHRAKVFGLELFSISAPRKDLLGRRLYEAARSEKCSERGVIVKDSDCDVLDNEVSGMNDTQKMTSVAGSDRLIG